MLSISDIFSCQPRLVKCQLVHLVKHVKNQLVRKQNLLITDECYDIDCNIFFILERY